MGVDVSLMRVTQPGTSPRRRRLERVDLVADPADLFARMCSESGKPMLSRVDPYGTLILTSEEMEQFISELEDSRARSASKPLVSLIDEVCALARRCMSDPALELKLDGD